MANKKYQPNQVINNFLLLEISDQTKNREYFFKCQCLKCKQTFDAVPSTFKRLKNCPKCKDFSGDNNSSWKGIGDISGSYYANKKSQAKHRKIEFTVTHEYLWRLFVSNGGRCSLSNRQLSFEKSHSKAIHNQGTASLDRIDSSKGYIEGNVQWIHKDINYMK